MFEKEKVAILGSGGREHALAIKISESPFVSKIFVLPGNAGMPTKKNNNNQLAAEIVCEAIVLEAPFTALIGFIKANDVGLVVVGPENLLAEDVAGILMNQGISVFGPTMAAAKLESSKAFAKEIMLKTNVATPKSKLFNINTIVAMRRFIAERSASEFPLVVKADGLCAGKGVVVASDAKQALEAAEEMLLNNKFGKSGSSILLEDFAKGEELSVLGVCRGTEVVLLPVSQDNKRLLDGDNGPNTGGMGVVSSLPFITPSLLERIEKEVFIPVLSELRNQRIHFSGVLYAGLMIEDAFNSENCKINVLEFNTRFGDPECQCVLSRIKSDLYPLLKSASVLSNADNLNGSVTYGETTSLKNVGKLEVDERYAVTVVLASGGYPSTPETGHVITEKEQLADEEENFVKLQVHYAAVKEEKGNLVTSGGRVLAITALAVTLEKARDLAYKKCNNITFAGMQFRKDIGKKKSALDG